MLRRSLISSKLTVELSAVCRNVSSDDLMILFIIKSDNIPPAALPANWVGLIENSSSPNILSPDDKAPPLIWSVICFNCSVTLFLVLSMIPPKIPIIVSRPWFCRPPIKRSLNICVPCSDKVILTASGSPVFLTMLGRVACKYSDCWVVISNCFLAVKYCLYLSSSILRCHLIATWSLNAFCL